jgi:hypothetical protein
MVSIRGNGWSCLLWAADNISDYSKEEEDKGGRRGDWFMSNANLWVFLAFFKSSMVASCNILKFYMYMLLKNLFNDIKFKITFRF